MPDPLLGKPACSFRLVFNGPWCQAFNEYDYITSFHGCIHPTIGAPRASVLGMRGAFFHSEPMPSHKADPWGPSPTPPLPAGCRLPVAVLRCGNRQPRRSHGLRRLCNLWQQCARGRNVWQACAHQGRCADREPGKSVATGWGVRVAVFLAEAEAWAASRRRGPPSIRSPGPRCARRLRI